MYQRPEIPAGAGLHRYDSWYHAAPDEAYGRVTDPDRFAPVVAAARALIAHFEDEGASVERGVDPPGQLSRTQHNIIEVIRVSTRTNRLTFVVTAFPGVILDIDGVQFGYPFCGCDHCDETALETVERLERATLDRNEGGKIHASTLRGPDAP